MPFGRIVWSCITCCTSSTVANALSLHAASTTRIFHIYNNSLRFVGCLLFLTRQTYHIYICNALFLRFFLCFYSALDTHLFATHSHDLTILSAFLLSATICNYIIRNGNRSGYDNGKSIACTMHTLTAHPFRQLKYRTNRQKPFVYLYFSYNAAKMLLILRKRYFLAEIYLFMVFTPPILFRLVLCATALLCVLVFSGLL